MSSFTIETMPEAYELLKRFFLEAKGITLNTSNIRGFMFNNQLIEFFLESGGEKFLEGPVNKKGDHIMGVYLIKLLCWISNEQTLFEMNTDKGNVPCRIDFNYYSDYDRDRRFYAEKVEEEK